MKAKAHVYARPHINTDEIIPARYLVTDYPSELVEHTLEDIDPDFVSKVREGDFLIATDNFGCGSSREHAVWVLREAGIRAIIANSFARIFYRNSINNGVFVIECPGIAEKIGDGDEIEIDVAKGKIVNITKNETYEFAPFPDFAIQIINAGGLMNHIMASKK
jgi:3-isopropylmalate/(R)-2-methylmalate dehydratase small subunit